MDGLGMYKSECQAEKDKYSIKSLMWNLKKLTSEYNEKETGSQI